MEELMMNKQLTDSGFRLMVMILNNKEPKLILTKYSNMLNWSPSKLARVTKHLIELGYVSKKRKSLGRAKGFEYEYEIKQINNLENI